MTAFRAPEGPEADISCSAVSAMAATNIFFSSIFPCQDFQRGFNPAGNRGAFSKAT